MGNVLFSSKRMLALSTMAIGLIFAVCQATLGVYLPQLDIPGLGVTPFADAFLSTGAILWIVGVGDAIRKSIKASAKSEAVG